MPNHEVYVCIDAQKKLLGANSASAQKKLPGANSASDYDDEFFNKLLHDECSFILMVDITPVGCRECVLLFYSPIATY